MLLFMNVHSLTDCVSFCFDFKKFKVNIMNQNKQINFFELCKILVCELFFLPCAQFSWCGQFLNLLLISMFIK